MSMYGRQQWVFDTAIPGLVSGSAHVAGAAFGSAFPISGMPQSFLLHGVRVSNPGPSGVHPLELHLFRSNFTGISAGTAWGPSVADASAREAIIYIGTTRADLTGEFGTEDALSIPIYNPSAPNGPMYAQFVTRATAAWVASGSGVRFSLRALSL